jgi:hypothetical protein
MSFGNKNYLVPPTHKARFSLTLCNFFLSGVSVKTLDLN